MQNPLNSHKYIFYQLSHKFVVNIHECDKLNYVKSIDLISETDEETTRLIECINIAFKRPIFYAISSIFEWFFHLQSYCIAT